MTKGKGASVVQTTLDDDFNVPDIKPDIIKIIQESAEIKINNIETMTDRVKAQGELIFTILYLTDSDQKPVHSMTGTLPFEEFVNLDGIVEDDDVKIATEIEVLTTTLINSRKVSVKGIVGLKSMVEEEYFINVATDVGGLEDLQRIYQPIKISQVYASKKDTYRVRDELALPNSKPNIMEILFSNTSIRNPEIRLLDDKINVKGEVDLFILYMGENEDKPVEFVEFELPFNGVIDCEGCVEEMIANVGIDIVSKDLQIKPDLDGEERLLDIEIITELDIKVYDQEDVNILRDIYSPSREMVLKTNPVTYENIFLKNQTQCKVNQKVSIDEGAPTILQICLADGDVKVDDIELTENGLEVEGVIFAKILYVAADDKTPLNVVRQTIPFQYFIEAKGITEECIYNIKPSLDYMSCNMLDDKEVEIRSGINLNTIIFNQLSQNVITDIEEAEIDMKKVQDLPSVVGYIVKKGDTLWDIAKRFYTTIDRIRTINELPEEVDIKPGDKLIIIKNVESLIS
jgi:hypothetical protein